MKINLSKTPVVKNLEVANEVSQSEVRDNVNERPRIEVVIKNPFSSRRLFAYSDSVGVTA